MDNGMNNQQEMDINQKVEGMSADLEQQLKDMKEKKAHLLWLEEILNNRQSAIEASETALQDRFSVCNNNELTLKYNQEALIREKKLLEKQREILAGQKAGIDKREQEQSQRLLDLESRESELRQVKIDAQQQAVEILRKASDEAVSKRDSLTTELAEAKTEAEINLAGWKNAEIKKLNNAYEEIRNSFDKDMTRKRESAINQLMEEVESKRKDLFEKLDAEVASHKQKMANELQSAARIKDEAAKEKDKLQKEISECEQKKTDLDLQNQSLEYHKEALEKRGVALDGEVDKKYHTAIEMYKSQRKVYADLLDKVREENQNLLQELESYDNIKSIIKENPQEIIAKISRLEQDNQRLRDELVMRPGPGDEALYKKTEVAYKNLQTKYDEIIGHYNELQDKVRTYNTLELENDNLVDRLKIMENHRELNDGMINELKDEIGRMHAPKEQAAEEAQRIEAIRKGIDSLKGVENPALGEGEGQPENELEWLNTISRRCTQYGISFPKRILYAFHTALKINDWSTITVLSGVSGTGKSELPRLYCTMGRMNFYSVAVQPNWDSQESMLGYFNSIDNRFDAQPVLRFLAQCTNKLDQCVSLVLLDEMNLAHVEYYFAEFLSKLEQRRGTSKGNEPEIEVKLGADCKPYMLPLKRCILWCGTMNQDETTKSLSDKVLDRGLLINFPRPTKLMSRKKMANLNKFIQTEFTDKGVPMLHYNTWRSWIVTDIENGNRDIKGFNGKQLDELNRLRKITEKINKKLGMVGRAIGHRVWQSIEFYIANYPEVIAAKENCDDGELSGDLMEAMHIAYEDQLVQKVMPKLRGIDTTGQSGKCLQDIRNMLNEENFNIDADFDKALKLGYGQFIWNSAEYVGNEIVGIASKTEINEAAKENN